MKSILAVVAALSASAISAEAASLPTPASLCRMISATADEGNQKIAKWQKSAKGYFCRSDGMSLPDQGVVFMNSYQAMGSGKSSAKSIYFHIQMFDSTLRTSQISELILSRITNIFAASSAGPVPDALVQAINAATTASVPTTLGLARTRLTLSSNAASPYNNAVFELQIDAP